MKLSIKEQDEINKHMIVIGILSLIAGLPFSLAIMDYMPMINGVLWTILLMILTLLVSILLLTKK